LASRNGSSNEASSARSATRDGTGRPRSPLWVGDDDVANPAAPASIASAMTRCIDVISSSVAARS
jgi:hypothetical protein